ncbi:MAG TPA: hypothetical protein VKA12_14380 [Roseiarcus sp.]|nr:hypothetical protein [Roseiarcus sp.]
MKEAGIVDALRAAPLEREDLPVLRQALRAAALPDGDLDAGNVNLYAFQQGDGVVGHGGMETYGDHALLRSIVVAPNQRRHR